MKRNYLITGGLGLIGSTLANKLVGRITVVSRSSKHKDRLSKKDVKLLVKPIQALTETDLKNIDIVYHCASTVDNYHVLTDPYIDVETNIKGTIHILELCKNLKKKPKIIFPSTFFVYGNTYDKTKTPIDETSLTDPLALYPATKLCVESIIKLYHRLYGIPYLICRLTNVYSENEDYNNKKKGALNYLIMEALRGNPLKIYKGGNFVRDYIHADDVVLALRFLESKSVNDIFLIGYGKPIKFKTLIKYILKSTGNKSPVKEIDPPFFHQVVGINNFVADTSKISSLGWKPVVSPKEGIRRVVKKYQSIIQ